MPVGLLGIHAERYKHPSFDELVRAAYRGKPVLNGEPGDLAIMSGEQSIESHDQCIGSSFHHRGHCALEVVQLPDFK